MSTLQPKGKMKDSNRQMISSASKRTSNFLKIRFVPTCVLFFFTFVIPVVLSTEQIGGKGFAKTEHALIQREAMISHIISKHEMSQRSHGFKIGELSDRQRNNFREKRSSKSNVVKREAPSYDPQTETSYYVESVFWNYAPNSTIISLEHFDELLEHIGLKTMTLELNTTEPEHNETHTGDHSDHLHDKEPAEEEQEVETCRSRRQLFHDYGYDEDKAELSVEEFVYLCPALIYQLDTGLCAGHGHWHGPKEGKTGSGHERVLIWVYTMLAVLIISLCALFGILCIPRKGRKNDKIVLQFLMALAMGTMSADGMLHLIPHAIRGEDHKTEAEDHEGKAAKDNSGHLDGMYKGLMALVGIYAFFFLERTFAVIRQRKGKNNNRNRNGEVGTPLNNRGDGYGNDHDNEHGHSHEGLFSCTSVATMIIVGDMFHNFCDGLAIGAAFTGSLSVGLSTSVAVFCHELPHEIGDFAVLITSGMSRKRAISFNLLSTVPCFLGAAIGLELGELGDVSLWIFAMVGGMFIYIALVDLVPEMVKAYDDENGPWKWYMVFHWVGMILGVIIMLILGIYEEDLQNMLT